MAARKKKDLPPRPVMTSEDRDAWVILYRELAALPGKDAKRLHRLADQLEAMDWSWVGQPDQKVLVTVK